jgi:hypothetical protein
MDLSPGDIDAIVKTTAAEAGGEPTVGQRAVAAVILNRANNLGVPPSKIVSAPNQFEGYAKGQGLSSSDPAYQKTLAAIHPILSGDSPDPTGGATHFLNPQLQTQLGRAIPAWASGGNGTRIGNHVFFGGPVAAGVAQSTKAAPPELPDVSDDPSLSGDFVSGLYGGSANGSTMPSPATLERAGYFKPQSAASTPPPPSRMPTPDELVKSGALPPAAAAQPPNGKPESRLQQAADQNATGEGVFKRGLLNAANGPLFGAEPFVRGMMAGSATAIDNIVHGKLLLSPSDIGGPNDPGAVARATTQAEQKANDAFYQRHPVAAYTTGIGGALAGGAVGGGLAGAAAHGIESAAARAVPSALGGGLGRLAVGAGATGAIYGGQSGLETAEGGGSLGQIAAATGEGAITGAALHGIAAGARPIAARVPTTVGKVIVGGGLGAAAGGALGAVTGQSPIGMALGALGGSHLVGRIGESPKSVVSPKLEESVLAKIPDADLSKLDAAPEGSLAAEALGDKGEKILAQRASEDPNLADKVQSAIDARNEQAPDRAAAAITKATGIDPSTASADIQDQIEANKRGPLKAAYDAALPGNPVWSDDLAEQFQRPEVRKAYNAAKIEMQNLGEKPELPNPNYQPPAPVARSNTGAAIIDPQVHQAWMAEGSNDPARLMQMQADHQLNNAPASSRQPQMIPTDRTLDLTKRNLDTNYNVTNPSERRSAAIMGTSFRNAIDPLIPGYAEARAQWGDTASYGDAYQYGRDLFKSGAKQQSATSVAERLNNETPANIQAIKHGIAAVLHEGLTNAQDLTPKLATPRMQSILKATFGEEPASEITHAIKQQAYLKKSGAKLVAKATPKDTSEDHSVLEGAVIGAAEAGLHPLRMIEHITGGEGVAQAVKSIRPKLEKGFTTKAERAVMADLATSDAKAAAAKIRAAKAKAPPPSNLHDLSRLGVLSLSAPVSNQISGSLADY